MKPTWICTECGAKMMGTCAWCGETPLANLEAAKEHAAGCEKHPIRQHEVWLDEARAKQRDLERELTREKLAALNAELREQKFREALQEISCESLLLKRSALFKGQSAEEITATRDAYIEAYAWRVRRAQEALA